MIARCIRLTESIERFLSLRTENVSHEIRRILGSYRNLIDRYKHGIPDELVSLAVDVLSLGGRPPSQYIPNGDSLAELFAWRCPGRQPDDEMLSLFAMEEKLDFIERVSLADDILLVSMRTGRQNLNVPTERK